jgi:uncharacterized protein
MTAPAFGLIFNETTTAPYPLVLGDLSTGAIVVPIDDAAPGTFPLNTPVLVNTSDPAILTNAGTGQLAQALAAINNQLGQFESGASLIVIAVPNGVAEPTQIANLLGSPTAFTGIYALLKAGQMTGAIPRLVGVPNHTGYYPASVSGVILSGCSGTGSGATISFTAAPTGGVTATGTVVVNNGVFSVNMTNPGSYPPGTVVTATLANCGVGAAAAVQELPLVNPIVAALPAILASLNATAMVASPGDGVIANSLAARQLLSSDRLRFVDAWVIPGSVPAKGLAYTDFVAEAIGLQIAVDSLHNTPAGSLPGWDISGHQVLGIAGLKNYYSYSLTDGSTQGQQLLAQQVGVIEAGVIGSDTALASSGFVFAGPWNASTDPSKWFVNKRRMKDWCYLQLIKSMRRHLGADNTTPQSVMNVLNDMSQLGSFLLSRQISIGFNVSFVASQTSPSNLQQGQFTVGFANETPAPITLISVLASDYFPALIVEEQTIIAEASGLTPGYIPAATVETVPAFGE